MNKLWGAATMTLAILALAGCSSGAPDASKVDAYRTVVRAMPGYSNITDKNLDKAADGVCGIFKADEATGWDVAVEAATTNGAPEAQAHILVRAAVAAYCPQYAKDLPAE